MFYIDVHVHCTHKLICIEQILLRKHLSYLLIKVLVLKGSLLHAQGESCLVELAALLSCSIQMSRALQLLNQLL